MPSPFKTSYAILYVLTFKGSWKGKPVLVGFPGMGLVGTITLRHIVEALGLKPVGYISHPNLPPVATLKEGVVLAPIRIYENNRFAAILSDVVLPENAVSTVAKEIVETAKKEKASMVISIAGVVIPGSGGGVFGAASHPELLQTLKKYKIEPVDKGMTTGISAALLLEGLYQDFPVLLILGLLKLREDFRAAADVIVKLDEMFGLNVDVGKLLEEAERIEREIADMHMQMKRAKEEARFSPGPYG